VIEALTTRFLSEFGTFGPTLIFAADVAHAVGLERGLSNLQVANGTQAWIRQYHSQIPVRSRHGTRSKELELLREEFLRRSGAGESPVFIGVDIIAEGLDLPPVQTLVLSRPTVSFRLYAQMIGRGLRGPAMGGSDYCNVLHFGAQTELGQQRHRSFADIRDVLVMGSCRVEHLINLQRRLGRDPVIRHHRSIAQAEIDRRRSRGR
jgi:superfamily II DNA or RNA helicase